MAILLLMEFCLAIGNVTTLIPYIENAEGVLSSCERLSDTDVKSWPTRFIGFLNPLSTRALWDSKANTAFSFINFLSFSFLYYGPTQCLCLLCLVLTLLCCSCQHNWEFNSPLGTIFMEKQTSPGPEAQ